MKSLIKISVLFLLINVGSWMQPQHASAQNVSVSFQVFYDDLDPYGSWINSPEYGYVWIPDAPAGFAPYATNGYWAYTDYGWTWVSYYPWGWAPFHYGRWYNDPFYGPVWIPGEEWGPAWVSWRVSDGYYGWCPMGPGNYGPRDADWRFVESNHFGSTTINNYYVNTSNNTTIINNTTVVNNPRTDNSNHVTYNSGPARADVEKHTGKPVTPMVVKESNAHTSTVKNNEVDIYKPPVVKKEVAAGPKPAPKKVADPKEVKTPAQKNQPQEKQQPQAQPKEQPKAQPPQVQPKEQQKQPQAQPKEQPKQQPQAQPKEQPKQQPQAQPKEQPKQQPQAQPKEQPQPQPKPQPQPQPQPQPKPQPQPRPQPHKPK